MEKIIVPMDGIEARIHELLGDHAQEINDIWKERGEEEDVTISMSVKLRMKEGQKLCDVGISYVKEKVRESKSFPWDDKQTNLFEKGKGKDKEKEKDQSSEF